MLLKTWDQEHLMKLMVKEEVFFFFQSILAFVVVDYNSNSKETFKFLHNSIKKIFSYAPPPG